MTPKRARGRLIVGRPAPRGWTPGCPPALPVRRCGCGARVVVRSVRFERCSRGCVHFPAPPPRPAPATPPPQSARDVERLARFEHELRGLRVLEADLVRWARRGQPYSPRTVALSVKALEALEQAYPDRCTEIAALLPWLSRKAAARRAA